MRAGIITGSITGSAQWPLVLDFSWKFDLPVSRLCRVPVPHLLGYGGLKSKGVSRNWLAACGWMYLKCIYRKKETNEQGINYAPTVLNTGTGITPHERLTTSKVSTFNNNILTDWLEHYYCYIMENLKNLHNNLELFHRRISLTLWLTLTIELLSDHI